MNVVQLHGVLLQVITEAGSRGITEDRICAELGPRVRTIPSEMLQASLRRLVRDGQAHRDGAVWKRGPARPLRARSEGRSPDAVGQVAPKRACTACGAEKAPSEFYAGNAKCRACYIAIQQQRPRACEAGKPRAPDAPATLGEATYRCERCGLTKPDSAFQRARYGHRSKACKACRSEALRQAHAAKREQDLVPTAAGLLAPRLTDAEIDAICQPQILLDPVHEATARAIADRVIALVIERFPHLATPEA